MIAEAFYGPPPSSSHVARHLDDDKSNNCYENIAWGTLSDNAQDCVRNGNCKAGENSQATIHLRSGELNGSSKLTASSVSEIRQLLNQGESQRSIARKFGVDYTNISHIKRGLTWKQI